MPMLEVVNPEYQDRMEKAVIAAIVAAATDPEANVATLLSGEIIQVCLNVIATMAGTSEVTASPTRLREFGDECGKAIRKRSAEARRQHEAEENPSYTVINAADRH